MKRAVLVLLLVVLTSLAAAQTIYRTPDGQARQMGNQAYDGRSRVPRIRSGGRGFFAGGSCNHGYPPADFYTSDALDTLTRMRVTPASTNVLDLEDPRIFDNPILYISEPG